MPKRWESAEERRDYYRAWFQTEKGQALRRAHIVKNAIANHRVPRRSTLQKYKIQGEMLDEILASVTAREPPM